jgi:chromosome segregation ATPase
VPQTSPYLDDLLRRWTSGVQDQRQEAAFQKELIDPASLAANGNRLALRERRRRDLRQLSDEMETAQARWQERLQRVVEWKRAATEIQNQESHLRRIVRSTVWLQKARGYQDVFVQRLERRAEALDAAQQALHEKLVAWQPVLEEREAALTDLIAKGTQAGRPLYVSRARKRPEIEFVQEQEAVNGRLQQEMRGLRRSLNHSIDRVRKAFAALDQLVGPQILYEVHRQEIVTALKGLERLLNQRREQILSDALIYESCRRTLRSVRETAHGLNCLEDIRAKPSGWKRFLS